MRIVSITHTIPYDGIPHAGGDYYLQHLRALLAAGHAITVVAPASELNRDAMPRFDLPVEVVLVEASRSRFDRLRDAIGRRVRLAKPLGSVVRAFVQDGSVRRAVSAADLLEYQWVETASLHAAARRWTAPGTPVVCVAHDVLREKYGRAAAAETQPLRRAVKGVRAVLVARDERVALARVDRVLVFSEKDRRLLMKGDIRDVVVVRPPLVDERLDRTRAPGSPPVVLFVGAFRREENAAAAVWLLQEVWPRVLARGVPAVLRLVGTHPSQQMTALADAEESVEVVGYVPDLDDYYRTASSVVVPLHSGAGVKFKTVIGMSWGIPVVSTSIGIEGIADRGSGLFVRVADDAAGFADGIIAALERPDSDAIGQRARGWVERRYGRAQFESRLRAAYSDW